MKFNLIMLTIAYPFFHYVLWGYTLRELVNIIL